jgi:hypothetical protein
MAKSRCLLLTKEQLVKWVETNFPDDQMVIIPVSNGSEARSPTKRYPWVNRRERFMFPDIGKQPNDCGWIGLRHRLVGMMVVDPSSLNTETQEAITESKTDGTFLEWFVEWNVKPTK